MKKSCLKWLRQEPVLCAAGILALASLFLVPPDRGYLGYVDLRVLGLLFSLMLVTAGLGQQGVFTALAQGLLARTRSYRQLCTALVFLCFFGSMVITNDVSLVTFVPFTVTLLTMAGLEEKLLTVVVLQTVAANLGSMFTPIGNPQNLYLYSASGMSMGSFLLLMLPLTAVSGVLLLGCCLGQKNAPLENLASGGARKKGDRRLLLFYWVLFGLSLLTVFRVLYWGVPLAFGLVGALVLDRSALKKVDYTLLLTFVAFFVFIGNMGRVEAISGLLSQVLKGRELVTGFLCSQVISNVPAAMLLSGFTDNWEPLLEGVNIGGLGTLIASMASLISWKLFTQARPGEKGRYLGRFTVVNVAFAVVLLAVALL